MKKIVYDIAAGEYQEVELTQEEIDEFSSPPPFDELKTAYERMVQAHIDSVAREQGYDSIYTAISYLGSSNPKWAAESVALRDWRDSVWLTTHGILNDVVAGERPLPAIEQVIAELPIYQQPEVV